MKDSVWTYFYNNKIAFTETYKNDRILSISQFRAADGKMLETNNLDRDGNGKVKYFYSDGTLKAEGELMLGLFTGSWKSFNPDSKLISDGNFKEGLKHGNWTYYNELGIIEAKGRYEFGEPVGRWEYFDEGGNLINEEIY